jgi:hypothetical protein
MRLMNKRVLKKKMKKRAKKNKMKMKITRKNNEQLFYYEFVFLYF